VTVGSSVAGQVADLRLHGHAAIAQAAQAEATQQAPQFLPQDRPFLRALELYTKIIRAKVIGAAKKLHTLPPGAYLNLTFPSEGPVSSTEHRKNGLAACTLKVFLPGGAPKWYTFDYCQYGPLEYPTAPFNRRDFTIWKQLGVVPPFRTLQIEFLSMGIYLVDYSDGKNGTDIRVSLCPPALYPYKLWHRYDRIPGLVGIVQPPVLAPAPTPTPAPTVELPSVPAPTPAPAPTVELPSVPAPAQRIGKAPYKKNYRNTSGKVWRPSKPVTILQRPVEAPPNTGSLESFPNFGSRQQSVALAPSTWHNTSHSKVFAPPEEKCDVEAPEEECDVESPDSGYVVESHEEALEDGYEAESTEKTFGRTESVQVVIE